MSMIKINSYVCKRFLEKRSYTHSIGEIQFQTDLADMYGLKVDESLLNSGLNNSFSFMGASLIDHLLKTGNKIDDVDLVVLVYCIPDINPSISTVNYLIEKYNLNAKGFAVSAVDTYAPFAAVKIIKELFFTKKCKKALLLMLDQSTLSYYAPGVKDIEDTAIACLFEKNGTGPCLELNEWGYESNTNLHEWMKKMNLNQSDDRYIISSNLEEKYKEMPSEITFLASSKQLCTSLFAKLLKLIQKGKIQGDSSIYLLDGSLKENELYYMKFSILGG